MCAWSSPGQKAYSCGNKDAVEVADPRQLTPFCESNFRKSFEFHRLLNESFLSSDTLILEMVLYDLTWIA